MRDAELVVGTPEWHVAFNEAASLAGRHLDAIATELSERLNHSMDEASAALHRVHQAALALPDGFKPDPRCDWCQVLDSAHPRATPEYLRLCVAHNRLAHRLWPGRTDIRFVLKFIV